MPESGDISRRPLALRQGGRLLAALAAVASLLWLSSAALEAGASRLLSDYAVRSGATQAAAQAAALTPSDPEAHGARAALFADAGRTAEAVSAYERALSLRPRDYALWLDLGRALDEAGDGEGAARAFREAAALAPFYAQPRWQLGNALLRAGGGGGANDPRLEEALGELRRATRSDPALFANLAELAWSLAGADARAAEQLLLPETPEEKLTLARLFVRRGRADAAVALYEQAGGAGEKEGRALLADLLKARQFAQAYAVWSLLRPAGGRPGEARAGAVTDGGFEMEIRPDEPGFGWQLAAERQGWAASVDAGPDRARAGARSLRVDFSGQSSPSARLLSQLIVVEPGARYRLAFAARAERIVSGGLPQVVVYDAAGDGGPPAAKSAALPQDTNGWREFSLEFQAPANSNAVRVVLQRNPCPGGPCPAFGTLWLDDFALTRLK